MKARQWYRFQANAQEPVAELFIYDDIGKSYWNDDAVTAKHFIDDLKGLPATTATVKVRVNSLGGDVFEAVAIANALRNWATAAAGRSIETTVEGIAASAASIVIMAGSTIRIADNAMVMVHNPWSIAIGNAAEMRKLADTLDAIRGTILATYKWHSSLDDEALIALMDAETWMDADGAIENGFATEKVEGLKAAASLSPSALAKLTIPEQFRARVEALVARPEPAPPAPVAASASEVIAAVDAAGLGTGFARQLLDAGLPLDQVNARIATEKAMQAAAAVRGIQIRALCDKAKQPELADGYIKGAMSPDDVRAHLTVITAKQDKVEIDAGLAPDRGASKKAGLNARDIYAARNNPTTKE